MLLKGIVISPAVPLSTLPLLTRSEQDQLRTWNTTEHCYPDAVCLHKLFACQAVRTPDALAITEGKEGMTYRELDRRLQSARELPPHNRSRPWHSRGPLRRALPGDGRWSARHPQSGWRLSAAGSRLSARTPSVHAARQPG